MVSFKSEEHRFINANEFLDSLLDRGYKPLDDIITVYKTSNTKCKVLCPNGHEWFAIWTSFKKGVSCIQCSHSKKRLTISKVRQAFSERGFTPLFEDDNYKNNQSKLKYICDKHPKYIQHTDHGSLSKGRHGCKHCFIERVSGDKSPMWKGGESELFDLLRKYIYSWKQDSMKNDNYKCVLTGKKFEVIHHLIGFSLILRNTLEKIGLEYKTFLCEYTDDEINSIKKNFLLEHNKILGVCLTREAHNLFHLQYGYGNNTQEQFKEYKTRYENGEFDTLLFLENSRRDN